MAIDTTWPWNTLQPGLNASSILGQRTNNGAFCTLCKGYERLASQCALSYMHPPVTSPPATAVPTPRSRQTIPSRSGRICISWNRGACSYPGCTFRHVCMSCREPHLAKDYPNPSKGVDFNRVDFNRGVSCFSTLV